MISIVETQILPEKGSGGDQIFGCFEWFFAGTRPNMADMMRLPPEKVRELRAIHGDGFSQLVYEQELEKHRQEMAEAWSKAPNLGRLQWWMEVDDDQENQ